MKIKSIKKIEYNGDVFNLRIKSDDNLNNNYIANGILVSNCHGTAANSVKQTVSKCKDSIYRFGLTGTLTNRATAEHLTIQQYLGPVIMEISPKFLFDNKYATPVYIKIIRLNWCSDEIREKLYTLRKSKQEIEGNEILNIERKLVISSEKRLRYIIDFISKTSKNSVVFFHSVGEGYGKKIYDGIREINPDKEVFYIDGDTDPDRRDFYKGKMEEGNDKLLISSYMTMSTGVSIKNIHNIFLVESYKSEIIIKQTLGRGMRLFEGKDKVNIIDFADDLSYKKEDDNNYLLKHSYERISIYEREHFPYKIYDINL